MIPQDLPPELMLARFRRRNAVLLVVGTVSLAVVQAFRPAPVAYLLVGAALGAALGWFGGNEPSPRRFWCVFFLVMIAFRVARDTMLGDFGGFQKLPGLSALLIAASTAQLLCAGDIVERRQQWWREHGPELTRGLNPNPASFWERWRFRQQVEARAMGWELHFILVLFGGAIAMPAAALLTYGRIVWALPLAWGVLIAAWGVYGMRLARRSNS